MSVADFNNDGYADLVISSSDGFDPIVVILFSGPSLAGSFAAPVNVQADNGDGGPFLHMVVADFNRDGFADVALSDFGEEFVTVLLNDPSHPGQFADSGYFFRYEGGELATADLNGDGALDLVIVNTSPKLSSFYVLPGILSSPGQFLTYELGQEPGGIEVGPVPAVNGIWIDDVNGDGVPDLVEATISGVQVQLGNTPAYSSVVGGAASYPGDKNYAAVTLQAPTGASLTSSRNSIVFGSRPVGVAGTSTVVFTNTTSAPLQVQAFPIQGPSARDFAILNSGNCPFSFNGFTIPVGSTCPVKLQFIPSSVAIHHGDVTFLARTGDFQEIALLGAGTAALPPGPLTFDPGVIEFGGQTVGTTGTAHVSVSNQSGTSATITGLDFTGQNPGDFSVTENDCPNPIVSYRAPCNIHIAFKPTAVGSRAANLRLSLSGGTFQLVPITGPGQ